MKPKYKYKPIYTNSSSAIVLVWEKVDPVGNPVATNLQISPRPTLLYPALIHGENHLLDTILRALKRYPNSIIIDSIELVIKLERRLKDVPASDN